MTDPVPVLDASILAVFHSKNLPGLASNASSDALVAWPVSPGGTAFMPMSGKYMVQAADGSQLACVDGFMVVGADGFPVWSAKPPA